MDDSICKYLTGEASDQEIESILNWLEESEENRRYFYDLKILWNAQSISAERSDLAQFASFVRETDRRIKKAERNQNTMSRRSLRWFSGVAAVAAIVVATLVLWKTFYTRDSYRVYENNGDLAASIMLDDGTQVWLNADTKLVLAKAFDKRQRTVKLIGSAFFDVAEDAETPFVVQTKSLQVRVLGTAFSIEAPDEPSSTEVILKHGSVRLQTLEGVNLVTLRPDQCASFNMDSGDLEISQVDASSVIFSRYELVTMPDATLHEIISHIETTYKVRISIPERYDNSKIYTFNYQYSNKLEDVLKIVEYMTGKECKVISSRDKDK